MTKIRGKNYFSEDFIAPDGGWGWIICIASGFAHVAILPVMLQFGIIFRDHLQNNLEMTNSQITSLTNISNASSFFVCALNGPIFRKFTFRQVGIFSAFLVVVGLFFTAFPNSYMQYLISISIIYGCGFGLFIFSGSLALNTYFMRRRPLAMGIFSTVSSVGPFIMPSITTFLVDFYSVQDAVLILTAFAMHGFFGALTFQPVTWHTKKHENFHLKNHFAGESCYNKTQVATKANENESKEDHELSCMEIPLREMSPKPDNSASSKNNQDNIEENLTMNDVDEIPSTIIYRICQFFELDLFKDTTYVILLIGLTLTDFAEMNFNILMPFILRDLYLSSEQTVVVLSLIAGIDFCMRLIAPLITDRIGLENRTYYLIGVLTMASCRIAIAHFNSYYTVLCIAVVIGLGKALVTIFLGLVIPSYISLNRLPAACGLQMFASGIFTSVMGPVVGAIRDESSVTVMLHCLNVLTFTTAFLWCSQKLYVNYCKQRANE